MRLEDSFEAFLTGTVKLDDTRRQRIISAHTTVRDELRSIDDVRDLMVGEGSYLQGSYALHTAVRPCSDDAEYDVDVVLTLDLADDEGNLPIGASVLWQLRSHLESISRYEGKTQIRRHCVRVQYESDGQRFHLDVLPAHRPRTTEGPIQIPPFWSVSDPKGYIAWLNQRQNGHCTRLKDIVRLLKFWRNLQQGVGSPNSMVLTTLVGHHAPASFRSVDDALVKTMRSIYSWAGDQSPEEKLEVPNPALPDENLARNWSWPEFSAFRLRLREATEAAEEALQSKDEEETIELWNGPALFDGRFPTTVRGLGAKALRAKTAMKAGGLYAGSSGRIGFERKKDSVEVPDNRGFFGDG